MTNNDRKLIAIFTILPTARSGIAIYSYSLINELKKCYDIHIFTDKLSCACRDDIHSHFCFLTLSKKYHYDAIIYQIGNQESFSFLYPYLIYYPGIVVLHDIYLYHSRAKYLISKNKFREYTDEMYYCHGYNGKRFAELSLKFPIPEIMGFAFAMNKLVIDCSLSIGVHSKFYQEYLAFHYPNKRIYYIPMSLGNIDGRHLASSGAGAFCKKDDEQLLLGSAGYVNQHKGILSILKALVEISKEFNVKFTWIGEDRDKLIESILKKNFTQQEQSLLEKRILITGYLNDEEFIALLNKVDIFLNLRYPTAGEFSGVLWFAMHLGKPIIMSDEPHLAEIPKEYVCKIALDSEVYSLTEKLHYLLRNPEKRQMLGILIKRFAEENYTMDKTINAYRLMIEQSRLDEHFSFQSMKLPYHCMPLLLDRLFTEFTEWELSVLKKVF